MQLVCRAVGKTDKGLVRKGNEDCLHLDTKNNVYLVCDGMGGHQAGEVASMTAVEIIDLAFNHFREKLLQDKSLTLGRTLPDSGDILVKAIRLANREIHNRSHNDSSLSGMGTTVVALALEADYMSIAHVGDSRAYRIEDKRIIPLTVDHSWVQELQDSQGIRLTDTDVMVGKNVITRALGVRAEVEVDYRLIKVHPGDIFMMCSDGLCGFADDDEIYEVAKRADGDIEKMSELLVNMANDRGGMDNVTVVAVEIEKTKESPIAECAAVTISPESQEILNAEDSWLQTLNEKRQQLQEQSDSPPHTKKADKAVLLAIFAAFIIIAVVILVFASGK